MKQSIKELKTFFVLWSTQSLSQLGSAMTSFALALWLYGETGSALADGAAFRLLLRALCGDERFRRGPQRPVGQEKGYACLRRLAALSTIAVLVLLKGAGSPPGTCTC